MAGQASILDNAEERARWEGFQWTGANAAKAREIIAPQVHRQIGKADDEHPLLRRAADSECRRGRDRDADGRAEREQNVSHDLEARRPKQPEKPDGDPKSEQAYE